MKPLDTNTWDYSLDKARLHGSNSEYRELKRKSVLKNFELPEWEDNLFWEIKKLMFALATNLPISERHDLDKELVNEKLPQMEIWDNYINGGGKTIGLHVCDLLSQLDNRLVVPEYFPANRKLQKKLIDKATWEEFPVLQTSNRIILRTSHHLEDWLCGNAGFFGSSDYCVQNYLPQNLELKLDSMFAPKVPIVLQKYLSDYVGLVISFGWSKVLGKNIARVATGRYGTSGGLGGGIRINTNATLDACGAYEVWCPETGKVIIPKLNYGEYVDPYPGFVQFMDNHLGELVSILYQGLEKLDFDFGVEFEIQIHHQEPDVWHLVQIRPCPDPQRSEQFEMANINLSEKNVATTPIVNTSFDVTGTLLPVNQLNAHRKVNSNPHHRDEEHILLWTRRMVGDVDLQLITRYQEYCQAQICSEALYPNSKHDAGDLMYHCNDDRKDVSRILKFHPLIGLAKKQVQELEKLAQEKPLKVRMISDGLVCRIFILD